ncbi:MAG: hypothetical protein ACI8PZ_005219 [Myxococcota bacterium]|jgi:hypothetical protein
MVLMQRRAALSYLSSNMGAGTFQAVMGAIQTCTHGSGVTLPAFPDMVMAMTWVTVENGTAVGADP